MQNLILREATYAQQMEQTVTPYLDALRVVLPFEREADHTLHSEYYPAADAVGTVLISHGFTETAEKYQECIYYFLQMHYNVLAFEHCGHGYSYRLVDDPCLVHVDNFHRYVDDLLAAAKVAREQQPRLPLYLFAHSMGGGIGAAALAEEPGLFQKAVLTSPMIRPQTGGLPWAAARAMARGLCLAGKAAEYLPGHHAFDGKETFADSASACEERFVYYSQKRCATPLYQMSGASCGWLDQAAALSHFVLTEGCKKITTPVLLFQAENDGYVNAAAQEEFARKVHAKLVKIPGAKHEIYNSGSATLTGYWQQIFAFFAE